MRALRRVGVAHDDVRICFQNSISDSRVWAYHCGAILMMRGILTPPLSMQYLLVDLSQPLYGYRDGRGYSSRVYLNLVGVMRVGLAERSNREGMMCRATWRHLRP